MDNYDFGCAGQPLARARANGHVVLLLERQVMMRVAFNVRVDITFVLINVF